LIIVVGMEPDVLKALADENRLAIVRLLAGGERCICEVASQLGLSDALVSHHLKRLRAAGLVRTRKQGQWLHCRLEPSAFDTLAREFSELAKHSAAASASCACRPARSTASRE
jgi:ArsR family transcriptional regulator